MLAPEPSFNEPTGASARRSRKDDVPTIIPLIQGLKSGTIAPRTISPSSRRMCIQEFLVEGLTVPEIAMILKCSERTIFRDLKTLRRQRVLLPEDLQVNELLGNLWHELAMCATKARRAARDKNARPEDKIDAERLVVQLHLQLTALLARLGFIKPPPQPPTRVRITLDGATNDAPDLDDEE